jgi:TPR repeat protein
MYDTGSGTTQNRIEAVRLYRMACSQTRPKKGDACFELALAYRNGDGIAADANGANQFFRQSCDLGVEKGCIEWHRDDCNRLGQPQACAWLDKKGLPRR